MGSSHFHESYLVPPLQSSRVPVIDMACLCRSSPDRSLAIEDIGKACREMGFFQVVNHGISKSVIDEALSLASDFFDLPMDEKKDFMSDDIYKPVRCGTTRNHGMDGGQVVRDFIKLYTHPLEDWVGSWPQNPPNYRKTMGRYAMEVRKLGIEVLGAIMESLGLGPNYRREKFEEGIHIMAINSYSSYSRSDLVLGIMPHSDHSIITILLQSCPGLQVMDSDDGTWRAVPELQGSLQVLVGDHLEVLSNGLYKSVLHRATPNSERTRLSIASLHSLTMDEMMEPAKELVDEEHPKGYKGSSLRDFLNYLSSKEKRTFIDTLKS